MQQLILTLTLAIAAAFSAPSARAEKADRFKPLNVEADALRYDDQRQTSVFTGRVVATKGTIVLRAGRVEVRQDTEGYQHALAIAAPGERAFWRQKRDRLDEYIEGEGETIEYDGRADRVRFISRAELRRYRGQVLADETSGSVITYDNATEQFAVDGGAAGTRPANPGGRVRATLAPRAEPPPAPGQAPTAPQGAPLRPSQGLGGDRR